PDGLVAAWPRLQQVLTNLVGNAIKFTERGEIAVRVERYAEASHADVVLHFAVRDTGIGIPPDRRKAVFEPFTQADGSTTRRYGGTGLGLSISSSLVTMMGGRIWLESEPDRGTTFHFTAPAARPTQPTRILVVDEDTVNRRLAAALLEKQGHTVDAAANRSEAHAALTRERYDLLLVGSTSVDGDAWRFLTHDMARRKAYRWGEDAIGGVCDRFQLLVFAPAFWNGRDPIFKDRYFGLTSWEGNHGEDVKEYYFYLDNTPTHSYMKYLYKYPQAEFPYSQLIEENRRRGRSSPEYELIDTGIFDDDRYFDVFVEYAKTGPEDIL